MLPFRQAISREQDLKQGCRDQTCTQIGSWLSRRWHYLPCHNRTSILPCFLLIFKLFEISFLKLFHIISCVIWYKHIDVFVLFLLLLVPSYQKAGPSLRAVNYYNPHLFAGSQDQTAKLEHLMECLFYIHGWSRLTGKTVNPLLPGVMGALCTLILIAL